MQMRNQILIFEVSLNKTEVSKSGLEHQFWSVFQYSHVKQRQLHQSRESDMSGMWQLI